MDYHTIKLWRWRVTDPDSGRRTVTRHRMTEANALLQDPTAERIESSLEERQVPVDPAQLCTSSWQRAG